MITITEIVTVTHTDPMAKVYESLKGNPDWKVITSSTSTTYKRTRWFDSVPEDKNETD